MTTGQPNGSPGADRIALLQTFVRIVEAGSLSAAARQLHTTQPTISRRLQALEQSMGLRLLQRSTHAMKLTLDGERCYAHAKSLIDTWDAMQADMRGADDEPEGVLRVLAPHAFGQRQLMGPLSDYLRRYPRMRVEWLLQDRKPDFMAENLDCAILVGPVEDHSVVAIEVAAVPRTVVAAPELLHGRPALRHARDLSEFPWLALLPFFRSEVALTPQRGGQPYRFTIHPRLVTDSLNALHAAALDGLGVTLASSWLMQADVDRGRLIQLLPEWVGATLPVHLVYPYAKYYPARLRRFIDIMRAAMPDCLGPMNRR